MADTGDRMQDTSGKRKRPVTTEMDSDTLSKDDLPARKKKSRPQQRVSTKDASAAMASSSREDSQADVRPVTDQITGTGQVSVRSLRKLAGDLGSDWEKLAIFLGMKTAEIANVKGDNPHSTENQIFAILIKWKQKQPASVNQIESLRNELEVIGRQDLADNLSDTLGETCQEEAAMATPQTETKSTCKHKEKQFYCETCEELICSVCKATVHGETSHSVIESAVAYNNCKQSLIEQIERAATSMQQLTQRLNDTNETKDAFISKIKQAIKDVEERTDKTTEETRTKKKSIIEEIEQQEQDRNHYAKTLKEMYTAQKTAVKVAKDVTKKKSHNNFLSKYPAIKREMTMLTAQPLPICKQTFPKFMPSQTVGNINLGTVVHEDTWELRPEFGKQESGSGDFEEAIGIAAAETDEMAVADFLNERVVICDYQGQIKSSIPEIPCDVARVSDMWVIPSCFSVKVYKDNTHISKFRTIRQGEVREAVLLSSVAVRKTGNSTIVGDTKRKVLTEHSFPDWSIIQTIRVETEPDFITVMNNDMIAVSDKKQGRVDLVDVVDSKAVTAFTIKPTIGGQPVQSCRGVCSSPNSSGIYVAVSTGVYNQGQIQHYNDTGQFISCVAERLYDPHGITFTSDGQLAVADHHSVKMYRKM